MEKKIIGYKLIIPEYASAVKMITGMNIPKDVTTFDYINSWLSTGNTGYFINRLVSAGVLHLWFEPIYDEGLKVGDWVLTSEKANGWGSSSAEINNKILKITKIDKSERLEYGGRYYFDNLRTIGQEILRKATEEEIEKAKSEIVKMFSSNRGEFEIEIVGGEAYYKKENQHLPKEWIEKIIESFGPAHINNKGPYNIISHIQVKVGCMEGTRLIDWKNVHSKLN